MERSTELGMQTFDQSLYQLYCDGVISYENAMQYADSQNNLRLMIKLGTHTGGLGRAAGLTLDDSQENAGQFFGRRP
jgi:twitching motility protein PilU